jgi:hypothetical protein
MSAAYASKKGMMSSTEERVSGACKTYTTDVARTCDFHRQIFNKQDLVGQVLLLDGR